MITVHLGAANFGPMPPVKTKTGISACLKTNVTISRDPDLINCKSCRKKMLGKKKAD